MAKGNGSILNREMEDRILELYHVKGIFIWAIPDILNVDVEDVEAVIRRYQ